MRYVYVFLIVLFATAGFALNAATDSSVKDPSDAVSIHAKERGFPRISFEDGKDLSESNKSHYAASPAKLLASADFDSDGTIDLFTANAGGKLRFYRGNVDSVYQNSPEAKQRIAHGSLNDQAFYPTEKSFNLSISPDFFAAGDFNADGFKDILAGAKNGRSLYLLPGDGRGNFRSPFEIEIDGAITAFVAGEIGRRDGQTDVIVAVSSAKGTNLLVFEHPEGAFKHKPEIIRIPAAADSLAIGNLDEDLFADIAVGSGNRLTLVHGRGQAYPFDLLNKYDIKRPRPIVETRVLSYGIAALEIGNFTQGRGESLAILTKSGLIQTLESPKVQPTLPVNDLRSAPASKAAFPAGKRGKRFSKFRSIPKKRAGKRADAFPVDREQREKEVQERKEKFGREMKSLNLAGKDQIRSVQSIVREESRQRAKDGFLRSISPGRSAPLADWRLKDVIADARLASAAFSPSVTKMIKVRVSESGNDELAVIDSNSKEIHLLISGSSNSSTPQTFDEIVTFDVETRPMDIVPMRLNSDGLSDLVVLRENSYAPTILMTAPVSTFEVNSTADNGICDGSSCDLRGAIIAANDNLGSDLITFSIGGGLATILPDSQLPLTVGTVTIDGTTQPGFTGTPVIEIKGTNLGTADGVRVNSSNSVVRGLLVNEFKSEFDYDEDRFVGGNGIVVLNFIDTFGSNNIVEGNHLGTDPTGTMDKGNDATGINIFDSDDNLVGGTAPAARNVMSGSGDNNQPTDIRRSGAGLSVVDGRNTRIKGNYIGTDPTGMLKINNSFGVYLATSDSDFGGDEPGAGNVVSGNGDPAPGPFNPDQCFGEGVREETAVNLDTGEFVTMNTNYKGNLIGTNAAGNAALGNCNTGILTSPHNRPNVGSITESGRNTISGNLENALYCSPFPRAFQFVEPEGVEELDPGFCSIAGNNVGTDVTGNVAIPNYDRNLDGTFGFLFGAVTVYNTDTFSNIGAPGGTSPSSCEGFCNLVAGNSESVGIVRYGDEGTVGIFNNYSGTNKNGSAAISNYGGVEAVFSGPDTLIGGIGTDESNNQVELGNLISGNLANGVNVGNFVTVEGNLIGTDRSGLNPIPNGFDPGTSGVGVNIGGYFSKVGGEDPLARNVIAANSGGGVNFEFDSLFGDIVNNFIGVNKDGQPLGNGEDGITLFGGSFSVISGNVIANNTRNGIYAVNGNTRGVSIRFNSIFENGTLGIDLSANTGFPRLPDGVTPNDCADLDEQANGLQNFPVLTAPTGNGDGTVAIEGAFQSSPSGSFVIDFYSNSSADPSDYGEGETYIGSKTIQTDEDGISTFLFTSNDPVDSNLKFTATATNEFGETSEFSCFAGQCDGGTGELTEEKLRDLVFPTCWQAIIVNVNTDEPDNSPGNGICDVDLVTPGLQCSLRGAIQTANAKSGYDLVGFDIPGGGVQTIAPTSELPYITEDVFLNATTQPGYVDSPMIELRGDQTTNAYGLGLDTGSDLSVISGFAINRFSHNIGIAGKSITVKKCYLGLSPDGSPAGSFGGPTNQSGVYLINSAATNNLIGSITADSGNVIANNNVGVRIEDGSKNNRILGNKIGTDPTGNNAIPNNFGIFSVESDNNQIGSEENGNIISGNDLAGVYLRVGSSGNKIVGNKIGTKSNGSEVLPNGVFGVQISSDASNNLLEKNVIGGQDLTGTSAGVFIEDGAGANNRVLANWIGVAADGTTAIPNRYGIAIFSDGQIIGQQSAGNTIGYSEQYGILIGNEPDGDDPETDNNLVQYNRIGTNGTASIGNEFAGITIEGSSRNNTVTKNIISGNFAFGILLGDGSSSNRIAQNFIGMNSSGTTAIPNGNGIWIRQSENNVIDSNLVSGNDIGILIGTGFGYDPLAPLIEKYEGQKPELDSGAPVYTTGNRLYGNTVGLNASRNAAIPGSIGIVVGENARNNVIGIGQPKFNLIAGNTETLGYGIFLGTFAASPSLDILPQFNEFYGNVVGIAGDFETQIPNNLGLFILRANNNTFGGDNDLVANFVVGSNADDVYLGENSSNNTFLKNYIGYFPDSSEFGQTGRSSDSRSHTDFGNSASGILVTDGAQGNTLGGATPETGLVIANSNGNGITISSTAGNGNSLGANSIFGNTGFGIDLGGDGFTMNDPGDADSGPNNLQNYPEIVSKQIVSDELVIEFKVDSAPANSDYGTNGVLVKFFKADSSGQGEVYLGATFYTVSDYNSLAPGTKIVNLGDITVLGISQFDRITATATDAAGNSSEFTPAFGPTAANVSVSGRVFGLPGTGLPGAVVTVTDSEGNVRSGRTNSFGYYRIDGITAGQSLVVSVKSKSYQFSPQFVSATDNVTDLNFTPNNP